MMTIKMTNLDVICHFNHHLQLCHVLCSSSLSNCLVLDSLTHEVSSSKTNHQKRHSEGKEEGGFCDYSENISEIPIASWDVFEKKKTV